jgi:hypothetical protein
VRKIVFLGLIGASLWGAALAEGHEVPVEQPVEMTIRPADNRLLVGMHIPATLLGEAKLPRGDDGLLDAAAIDPLLPVIAAETARNLDFRQGDAALPPPAAAARLGADHASVDIELSYALDARSTGLRVEGGGGAISARLNAFPSTPLQPARTNARFFAGGGPQTISVTGPAQRVTFDPGARATLRQFAANALGLVLAGGDHLLFLVCLLLPMRPAREAIRLAGLLLAGQLVGVVTLALMGDGSLRITVAALVAASFLVVAALQNVIGARRMWVAGVTAGLGLVSGVAFGDGLLTARQFAGAHQALAALTFLGVAAAAQIWLGAVIWATRRWLADAGAPDRIVTVLGSVFVAHEALHRVDARGHALAETGTFAAGHAIVWLVLAWALVMIGVGVFKALTEGRLAPARRTGVLDSTGTRRLW